MVIHDKISVLVIEQDKSLQNLISDLLLNSTIWKFEIDTALNMTTALTKLKRNSYNIILTDLVFTDSNRTSTVRILNNEFSHVPYIILAAADNDESLLESIEAGAQNSLYKDDIPQGSLLSYTLYKSIEHWKIINQFKYMDSHDDVTDALNKRFFMKALDNTIITEKEEESHFSLAICDLDNFRNVNTNYGHIIGDKALQIFASTIKQTIRKGDIVGRFGGDEFYILFNNSNRGKCLQYLSKLSSLEIEVSTEEIVNEKILIKGSYGAAQYEKGMKAEDIINLANRALYDVKENGKGFYKII